ncbi:MAG: hypothetical protein WAL25_06215 [Acidimicrobiia bacterium]
MAQGMAELGERRFASAQSEDERRYLSPLSPWRRVTYLLGMLTLAVALTVGGIHLMSLAISWQ